METRYLDWDSQFFGFKTARILPAALEQAELYRLLENLRKQGMRLVYWGACSEPPFDVTHLGGRLVDRKTIFEMDLPATVFHDTAPDIPILPYIPGAADETLFELALQAGEYSRFARDPQFPHEIFQALYREWMRKSLSGELADAVLAAGSAEQPLGMVTLSAKSDHGEIGLIAVDAAARGRHIGATLVRAAQAWYFERGLKRARVVTQGENLPACRLYAKCGYTISEVEYLYHFWL